MTSPVEASMADDDLSRQRRNLEARLLDRPVPNFPALTVADVLATSDEGHAALDAPSYLAERVERCHTWTTIEKVVAYLQRPRPGLPDPAGPVVRPLPQPPTVTQVAASRATGRTWGGLIELFV